MHVRRYSYFEGSMHLHLLPILGMGVGVHWRNGQARFSEKVDIYGRSLSLG